MYSRNDKAKYGQTRQTDRQTARLLPRTKKTDKLLCHYIDSHQSAFRLIIIELKLKTMEKPFLATKLSILHGDQLYDGPVE